MKKKRAILYPILFFILMVLLFLPMAQEYLGLFKMKPLKGVYEPADVPELTLQNYANGRWQRQLESYVAEHFGFREPIIRLYNQYVYDFFHKTYSEEISVGKDGWLYQKDGVLQYFGLKGQFHGLTNEQFKENLDIETRSLVKIRAILKEYGVELMTFTLPVKSYIYPEHLRPQPFVDTTFDAGVYYEQRMHEAGFPHINMTPWFQDIRNDYPFTLFYEKGSHWASGAVIGTDSLLRFMETLKGEHFPRIVMGEPYAVAEPDINPKDKELAALLNVCREPRSNTPLYEIPVSIACDSSTIHPNVLFVGSSYYWYMTARIPFREVFSNRDFMYYDLTYFSDEELKWKKMEQVNTMREMLLHDYVVYFKNAPQLYSDGFNFFGKALIGLCISDERLKEKMEEVADSLMLATHNSHPEWKHEDYLYHARIKIIKNPELFEELRGEAIPKVRNPKIQAVMKERTIRADRDWRFILHAKAVNDSIDIDKLYEIESHNLLNGKILLKKQSFFTPYDYFEFLLEEMHPQFSDQTTDLPQLNLIALQALGEKVEQHELDNDSLLRAACVMSTVVKNLENEKSLASIRDKAQARQWSIDKMFNNDAVWCFNNIKDWSPYFNENTIQTAFDLYKIERGLRKDPATMAKVRKKCQDEQLPFRAALDGEINWVYNHNNR